MNVFDIALDFVLLDAFTDLQYPPSTIVAVLQNRWITDGMKKAVSCPFTVLRQWERATLTTTRTLCRLCQLQCGRC